MATKNDLHWQVLLDDDAWENLLPTDAPVADARQVTPAPRAPHPWRGLLLGLSLLPVALLIVWIGETKRPAQPSATRPVAAASADRLAAQARAVILTEHLRIYAAGADVAIAQANAPVLEAMYRETYAALGLGLEGERGAPDGRLSVVLARGNGVAWQRASGQVVLPSPAYLGGEGTWDESDLLRQGWTLALIERAIWQAGERHRVPAGWLPQLKGTQLWLLWRGGGPLAQGREEIVAWLYAQEQHQLLDDAVQEMCRVYALWDRFPHDFSIPIGCAPGNQTSLFALPIPKTLSALGLPEDENDPEAYFRVWTGQAQTVTLALLIQYATDHYGRETIPKLLAGLKDHSSWQTLIPAVFGVPAAEFEAGWQAWLAEKYARSR